MHGQDEESRSIMMENYLANNFRLSGGKTFLDLWQMEMLYREKSTETNQIVPILHEFF